MRFIWKRLSLDDIDRLTRKHNLNNIEGQILNLLRNGITYQMIGLKVGYEERQVRRISCKIFNKIKDDILK